MWKVKEWMEVKLLMVMNGSILVVEVIIIERIGFLLKEQLSKEIT